MKRLIATIAAGGILAAPATALANPGQWAVQLSTPFSATLGKSNTRTFTVGMSASSVNTPEILTVKLYQNGVLVNTFADTTASYGGSWSQTVTAPADGTYTYKLVGSNSNGDPDKIVETAVSVDATAPSAATYLGKTQAGTSYTVNFSAPNDDVSEVRVFASTATSFAANSSTQVAVVAVTAGQKASVTYNAPDAASRYFAVQAFDSHGNGSTLTGDAIVVSNGSATTSSASATTGGRGGGASASRSASTIPGGVVESTQKNNDDKNKEANKTSNVASANKKTTNWTTVFVTLGILGALYAGYKWFMENAEKE